MGAYLLAGLVIVAWVGSGSYCWTIARRARTLPEADEESLVSCYSRWGRKKHTIESLGRQVPQLEAMVPGLRYTAIVPLSIAAMFGLNALARVLWIKDGTMGVWLSIGLIFLPIALTVYVLAWEQGLQLERLKEVASGPSGMRVADMRARLQEEKALAQQEGTNVGEPDVR